MGDFKPLLSEGRSADMVHGNNFVLRNVTMIASQDTPEDTVEHFLEAHVPVHFLLVVVEHIIHTLDWFCFVLIRIPKCWQHSDSSPKTAVYTSLGAKTLSMPGESK